MNKLVPVIGVEVHTELKTKTKAFSSTENSFQSMPNSKVNAIDLGYPGTLPNINHEIINKAIALSLALHCNIQKTMHFDRKNYFYPDLPKGYQITQKDTPIGYDGYLEIEIDGTKKKIFIEELHLEEDTCKSIHENGHTLLNYNRAGVPLIEIVTKPCMTSGKEASLYVEALREILEYLDVSDGKIEEGSLRCDANVSLKKEDSNILGTKTEIKNIGSISNINLAITYEIKRQQEILEAGGTITEETRRYDEKSGKTILMRKKETGNDYRYFSEPDIPSIVVKEEWIEEIKKNLPVLPNELRKKYSALNLTEISKKTLLQNKELCDFYEQVLHFDGSPVGKANLLTGDVLAWLNKNNKKIDHTKMTPKDLSDIVVLFEKKVISNKMVKELLPEVFMKEESVATLVSKSGNQQISNKEELEKIIHTVLERIPTCKEDYQKNKDRTLKYLMGMVMKESKGLANPNMTMELLNKILNC